MKKTLILACADHSREGRGVGKMLLNGESKVRLSAVKGKAAN